MPSKRNLTRETVISAAADLMDRCGEDQVTLGQVATSLGIRTPSLYNHIGGLEELRQEVAVAGARELRERIGNAAIGKSGEDALVAIAWSYREFARERPGLYLATQRAPRPDQTALAAEAEKILRILRLILEPFGLGDEEQVHAIRALRSVVHGFVSLEIGGGFGMPVDTDTSFGYLVEMYVARIRHDHGHSEG